MKTTLVLTIVLLVAMPASAQIGRGVVTGQIRAPSGAPAAGLRVAAVEAPDTSRPTQATSLMASIAQTDSEGRFRLEDIPPGRYYIVAGKIDSPVYYPGERGISAAKPVTIVAGSTISGINFTAVPPLKVSGRIVGLDAGAGNASEGIVWLIPAGPSSQLNLSLNSIGGPTLNPNALSASLFFGFDFSPGLVASVSPDGSFEFGEVPSGTYTLQYAPQRLAGRLLFDEGAQQPANQYTIVVAERNVTGLTVGVPRTISGHIVVDQNGPVPPFKLSFVDSRDTSIVIPVSSSAIWPSFIATLPWGSYRVDLSNLPRGYSVKSITHGARDVLRAPLTVGDVQSEIVVTLNVSNPPPWVKVTGRVTGPGSPAARVGTVLSLHDASTRLTATSILQPDGAFEFDRVFPGVYEARFDPALEGVNPIEVFIPRRDLIGVEIHLPAQVRVAGRVTVDKDNAIPPIRISLAGLLYPVVTPEVIIGAVDRELRPERDGKFSVIVPEGEYRVTVSDVNIPYAIHAFSKGSANLLTEPLKVRARATEDVSLALSIPVFAIRGHVYPAGSAGLGEVRMELSTRTGVFQARSVRPGADGAFELRVPSGEYRLRIDPFGTIVPIVVNGADVEGMDFTVVRGRATVTSGGPIPWMGVWFSSDVRSAINVAIGQDGTFVTALPPGGYRVTPNVPSSYTLKSFGVGTTDLMKEGTMTVGASDQELRVVLEPKSPARITGKVIGSQYATQPLVVELLRIGSFERFEAPVRADGSFEIRSVPWGFFQLRVPPELAVGHELLIEMSGDLDGVTVEIPRQVPIQGRVVVEGGESLPDVSGMVVMALGPDLSAGSVRPDGTFSFVSTFVEQRISVRSVPSGYEVKSVTARAVNLLEDALVPGSSPVDIQIVLSRRP